MEAEMELTGRAQRGVWTRPGDPGPGSRERPGKPAAPEQSVTVEVRQEAPFLPKVAFTLITIAPLAGSLFTGQHLGVSGLASVLRWLNLWALGLSTGFLAWRVFYLREREPDVRAKSVRTL